MLLPRIGVGLMTSLGAEGHRTERGDSDASLTKYFSANGGSSVAWSELQDYDFMLMLLAGLLVLLVTVFFFFFGLFLGKRRVACTHEVVSEDQDNVSLSKSTKAQPVPGVGILSENDRLLVLETAGAVSSTTEKIERYLAQKGVLLRYTVTSVETLLCTLPSPIVAEKTCPLWASVLRLQLPRPPGENASDG